RKIFELLDKLHNEGLYNKNGTTSLIGDGIEFSKDLKIEVLAPTGKHQDNYLKRKKLQYGDIGVKEKSDLINSLSYVLLLKFRNSNVLFTSDAPPDVQEDVIRNVHFPKNIPDFQVVTV